jgi:hypothetical protein
VRVIDGPAVYKDAAGVFEIGLVGAEEAEQLHAQETAVAAAKS